MAFLWAGPTVCYPLLPTRCLVNSYLYLKCELKYYFPRETLPDPNARLGSQLYGLRAHCVSAFST